MNQTKSSRHLKLRSTTSLISWNTSPSFNHLQSAYRKHHSNETSLIHLLDSIYHAADNVLATLLLYLSLLCCIWLNWPHLSPQSSYFPIWHHGFLSQLAKSYLPNKSFSFTSCSFWFLFHITFIWWCSSKRCLRSHFFTIYVSPIIICFNCILTWCQSTAICWQYDDDGFCQSNFNQGYICFTGRLRRLS